MQYNNETVVTIRLSKEEMEKLKKMVALRGKKRASVVRELIRNAEVSFSTQLPPVNGEREAA